MNGATGLGWLTARPVAHRGLHDAEAGVLENTLAAIDAAVERDYAVEIDVQSAAGGEPVVFHDATLDRLAGRAGRIAALSPAELAGIPMAGTDNRIPQLADVLSLVDRRVPLIVEIKTDWSGADGMCARIADIVRDYDGPLALMSFDPVAVANIRKIVPWMPRGIVSEAFATWQPPGISRIQRHVMRHMLHAGGTRPHFVAYCVDDLPALAPLAMRTVVGLPLLAWTVRSSAQRSRADTYADQMIFEGFRP